MNRNVQRTWDFVKAIAEAKTIYEVQAVLRQLSAQYGMETTFGGVIPQDLTNEGDLAKMILVADIPIDWTARYLRENYVRIDPILHYRTDNSYYSWDDAYRASTSAQNVKTIKEEAAAFGLKEGFVVPVWMLDGSYALMSFGGTQIVMSPEEKSALSFATNYAVGQLIFQKWHPKGDMKALTTRETDCLLWASEGKTDWEISVILGIGVPTVEKHMQTARVKLNAMNKHHAVAQAMRYRMIK